MKSLELIREWMVAHPTSTTLIKYVILVMLIIGFIQFLRRFIRKNLPNSKVKYKSQKGIEVIGYLILVILTLSYFTGNIKDFTLAIGLLSAGVAITLQELILSIAGSLYN